MTTTQTFTPEMRERWEKRKQEQARLEHIFSERSRGDLNLEAITILIGWAEQDEEVVRNFNFFGTWDQGTWGTVSEVPMDLVENVEEIDPDDGEMFVDATETRRAAEKAMLNGVCETAYCMAGQTVVQAGYAMLFDSVHVYTGDEISTNAETCVKTEFRGFDERGWPIEVEVGERASISNKAASILGLTARQQEMFFSGGNEVDDLKRYANEFAHDAGVALPYPDHESAEDFEPVEFEDDLEF